MIISIIVALSQNNYAIGKDNALLWHLPDDMKRFKSITSSHSVIMGRNTFLSLPKGALPNRRNIVISDNSSDVFEGCEMANSVENALNLVKNDEEVFVIGGASVYKQFLNIANKLYLTFVDDNPDADVFFPIIQFDNWQEIENIYHPQDDKHDVSFSFVTLIRKVV